MILYDNGVFQKCLSLAQEGNLNGMYCLGMCYLQSDGVEQNLEETIKWWKKAADGQNFDAIKSLTDLYAGAPAFHLYIDDASNLRNEQEHVRYAAMGTNLQIPYCVYCLGNIYRMGICGYSKSLLLAVDLWMDVAAMDVEKVKNIEKTNIYSPLSVYRAITYSCKNIGTAYFHGGDGVPKNIEETLAWWKRAANMGCRSAAAQLFDLYERGDYVAKDKEQAEYWCNYLLKGHMLIP